MTHATSSAGEARPTCSEPPRCQCDKKGVLSLEIAWMYDRLLELPFVEHAPNECTCKNDLALYRMDDGSEKWLCSVCWTEGERVNG